MEVSVEVGSTIVGLCTLIMLFERFIKPFVNHAGSNCESHTRTQNHTSIPNEIQKQTTAQDLMREIKPMSDWQFAVLLQIMLFSSATGIASFALGSAAPSRLEIVLCIFSIFMFLSAPFVYQARLTFLRRIVHLQNRINSLR